MISRWCSLVLFLIVLWGGGLEACEFFGQGNQHYFSQDYSEAVLSYENCLSNPGFALYFNLGNSFYKLQEYGKSRLYYEKARQLNPGDKNLTYNSSLLEEKLVDEEDSMFQVGPNLSIHQVLLRFLGVFLLTSLLFLARVRIGAGWYQAALLIFLAMGFYFFNSMKGRDRLGVVLDSEVSVYSNQNLRSSVLVRIHEGKMLKIVRESQDWILVKVKTGIRGWVLAQSVGRV